MKIFQNVAALKAAILTAGQLVETKGYYDAGDGGQARYLITTDGVADEHGNHTLPNGTVAVLQYSGAVNPRWFGALIPQNSPFGQTGIRLITGEKRDTHSQWASIVELPNANKWVMVYRKATEHGIEDGTECRAADSYDFGVSWVNDRLVQTDPATDSRADRINVMANGRIGFFCSRASAAGPNKYPLFISSDDGGVTWDKLEVPTASLSYTFAAVGGIVDFPSSQGGNDTTGFITFGYINAGGVDAFTTVDNGDSWSIVSDVNGSVVVSENVIIRLGETDRWLIYVRNSTNVLVYATTDILSWGTSLDAGVESLSTPPAALYDAGTDKVYYFGTARAGKEIEGYTNNILQVGEDAETLWAANGVFTTEYTSLLALPNWTTGYLSPFTSRIGVCATVSAGENASNGLPPGTSWVIGDFNTSASDIGLLIDKFIRNQYGVNLLDMKALDNISTTYPLKIYNASRSASAQYGAYGETYNTGAATYSVARGNGSYLETFASNMVNVEYAFNNTGYTRFSGSNIHFKGNNSSFGAGATEPINGDTASMQALVGSSTISALRTAAIGTGSSRKHFVLHHSSGGDIGAVPEVGSISTTTTATAFNTSSDETLKDFVGEYNGQEAINIIKADPVRVFNWKSTGERAVGWGAQTSYQISNRLATKGGWFLEDEEVAEGTEGAAYVQWGVDQGKRTPYLWAAMAHLIEEVERLTAIVNKLTEGEL